MYSPTKSWMATSPAAGSTAAAPATPQLGKGLIFATSGLGGMMGWAVVHPANTVAVRSNLASTQGKPFSFQGMIKQHGWMSLYDGLPAGLIRQIFYASSRFGLFETFRDLLHEYRGTTDFASRVAVGAISGGMAAYISCPAEVATVRMSNDATLPPDQRRNYKNVMDTATRIVKEEGLAAFWRGSGPFVNRAMMVGVFQVATLDQFKVFYTEQFNQTKNSIPNVFCAAMTSGLIYSIVTMPLEASKNRMASQKADPTTGKLPYTGTIQTLSKVATENGIKALYEGFLPYYMRCGGHTVSMFISVQLIRDAYVKYAV
mmetsp:Transcript_1634/g.2199  ORF Transcript_1634/g.2199 Transcript_1634/m.2199 type:complete len:316 (+) Transcript_1634:138-1085(+)